MKIHINWKKNKLDDRGNNKVHNQEFSFKEAKMIRSGISLDPTTTSQSKDQNFI